MPAPEISSELKAALKKLKLGPLIDTLPERLVLANKQKMPYEDLLLLILSRDEKAPRTHVEPRPRGSNRT